MIRVVHLIRSFGNPTQPYTSHFLELLANSASTTNHLVISDRVDKKPQKIKVLTTNTMRSIFKINIVLFIVKRLFLDREFNQICCSFSIKQKIKFLLKWEPLLNRDLEVLHVHHLQTVNFELLKYLQIKNVKMVLSLRGKDIISDTIYGKSLFLEKVSYFKKVHVISKYMYSLSVYKGIPKHKLKLVYRGVDKTTVLKQNIINFKKTAKQFKEIRAIIAGRLAWEKGHIYALDSVYRLKQKGVIIKLDIYGEGSFREFMEYRIHQLQLENEVFLKGHVVNKELKTYYKNYDIAIQPSIYEALSNGLLDFVFHGLPCVISNVGGMVEIIEDGINGKIFNINKPSDMDESIIESLLLNKDNLLQFNQNLYKKFTIQNEIEGMTSLYVNLDN